MYLCRRIKLCSFLIKNGFRYEKVVKDKYNPKYNCWLFKNTPELLNKIDEYYSEDKTKRKAGHL